MLVTEAGLVINRIRNLTKLLAFYVIDLVLLVIMWETGGVVSIESEWPIVNWFIPFITKCATHDCSVKSSKIQLENIF